MDDLARILKNAGLKEVLLEETEQEEVEEIKEESIEENEELSQYSTETYAEKLKEFMKVEETAGVGLNAEFNTYPYTPDIKKGTLKKTGEKLGFDITDEGIPPIISKDSVNKS